MNTKLFSPLKIKDITFKNRIFMAPMCQDSAIDGMPNEWHMIHLGSRATGGSSLIIVEATAVNPEGRITWGDLGIWNDEQMKEFSRITKFIKSEGAVPGIQIAHAGRKASCDVGWKTKLYLSPAQGGWNVVAPSPVPFSAQSNPPHELNHAEIENLVTDFKNAAIRSLKAGFEVLELHMAHGYLMHEFLSPLSNKRNDEYGGSLQNRMRFPLKVAAAVREVWPQNLPLFVRISATDWVEGGWDIKQSVALAHELKNLGIDFIDTSSGGMIPDAKIPLSPGYQVPFAEEIKREVNILTGAVGLITKAQQAEQILNEGKADVILLGRELLRDPYWPLHAAKELGEKVSIPKQYVRAF
jgi:2,4-dienoyl-CoA reductase-like NADH-dependent reductase (Old Yellow Enzyme family)